MTFCLTFLFGVCTAIAVMKKCSFQTIWVIFFNLCVSVYTSIMIAPSMLNLLPSGSETIGYHVAACVLVIAILVFIVLQIVAVTILGTANDIALPSLLEKLSLPFLGFTAGYILCSFILFLVVITPAVDKSTSDSSDPSSLTGPLVIMPVVKTCDFISKASMQCFVDAPISVVDGLMALPDGTVSGDEIEGSVFAEDDESDDNPDQ